MSMNKMRDALVAIGFQFVGFCPVCSGRGHDYRKDSMKVTVKTDGNNNELVAIFDGLFNGRRIINQVAIPDTIQQKLQEIGYIKTTA